MRMLRNDGLAITSMTSSTSSASTGQTSGCRSAVATGPRAPGPPGSTGPGAVSVTSGTESTSGARVGASGIGLPFRVSGLGSVTSAAGDDLEQVVDRHVLVRPLVDLAPVTHHDDAVAEAQHLLELCGDEDHGHALARQVRDECLDLRLRA